MNTKIKLQATKLPKMLSDLSHSNQFLKVFSISTLGILALTIALLLSMTNRAPIILTLSPAGEALDRTELPKPEDQVRAAINRYLDKRYKWQPENVKQKMMEAQAFVLPASQKAFQGAIANVVRFSTEKLVSQRVFPDKIDVNLDKKTAFITGDRMTMIQNLKAAGNLRLELSFESGPRTRENPWGLYITKEREEL